MTFAPPTPTFPSSLITTPPQPKLPFLTPISRRTLLSLTTILTLQQPSPATAFSIGFSGPKDWLREQKKKASQVLLGPIDASRESIRGMYLQLSNDSGYPNKELSDVQGLIKLAARDCVVGDRNSFVSFQAKTGVEVCTFNLIVKNAASLLDDKDSRKLGAEAMLGDLIRSFTSLNGVATDADLQNASSRQKVADALMDTISSLDKFKQGIKDCLEV